VLSERRTEYLVLFNLIITYFYHIPQACYFETETARLAQFFLKLNRPRNLKNLSERRLAGVLPVYAFHRYEAVMRAVLSTPFIKA